MQFDPNNPVIQLCAQGMESESKQEHAKARDLFQKAWELAQNDFEKFTAAHYVARQQESASKKLEWDMRALSHALALDTPSMSMHFPSLYLNIGKDYEDLGDYQNALTNYQTAERYSSNLGKDSYGKLVLSGITNGINRIQEHIQSL